MTEAYVETKPTAGATTAVALRIVVLTLACAGANIYLCYLSLNSMPDLSGIPRGWDRASPVMRLLITLADSPAFRLGVVPGAPWLACVRMLWRSHGARATLGLATGITVFWFLGSFWVAGALWGS